MRSPNFQFVKGFLKTVSFQMISEVCQQTLCQNLEHAFYNRYQQKTIWIKFTESLRQAENQKGKHNYTQNA